MVINAKKYKFMIISGSEKLVAAMIIMFRACHRN